MSPTIFVPGTVAVKSRRTRSGIGGWSASYAVRDRRNGRGWQATRSSSRMR